MAKKSKPDQLSWVGLISAILRNTSQQRSMVKSQEKIRAKREAREHPLSDDEKKARKKQQKQQKKDEAERTKDTRSAAQIGDDVDTTRGRLLDTVDAVKYDLDVPARLTDARTTVARSVPRSWLGPIPAAIAAGVVLVVGWGAIAAGAATGARREG